MRRRKSDQRNVDIVIDLPTKVWWSTEIRIWGLAAAAVLGIVSFAATWAQTRWQAELSQQKDETSKRERLQAEERIAAAQADAARASEQAALAAERTAEMRAKNLALEAALSPRWMEQNLSALALHNFAGTMYDVASPNDFEPKRTASQIKFMLRVCRELSESDSGEISAQYELFRSIRHFTYFPTSPKASWMDENASS